MSTPHKIISFSMEDVVAGRDRANQGMSRTMKTRDGVVWTETKETAQALAMRGSFLIGILKDGYIWY